MMVRHEIDGSPNSTEDNLFHLAHTLPRNNSHPGISLLPGSIADVLLSGKRKCKKAVGVIYQAAASWEGLFLVPWDNFARPSLKPRSWVVFAVV